MTSFRKIYSNKIKIEGDCWIWTGAISKGYGLCSGPRGKIMGVHRYSFQVENNCSILPEYEIHHKCKNNLCCNPNHLELQSKEDHRRITKGWIKKGSVWFCGNDHEMNTKNTYIYKGIQRCKICVYNRRKVKQQWGN